MGPINTLASYLSFNDKKKVSLKLTMDTNDLDMIGSFKGCRNLIDVRNLPKNVKKMTDCFAGCESLIGASNIPAGVTDMNRYHKSADLKTRKIKKGQIWSSTIKNLRNRHCYCRMR